MEKSDKKRILTRVLIVIAALTLLSCCFLGSTFARYVTKETGSAQVGVAKWDIGVETAGTTNVTVNTDKLSPDDTEYQSGKTRSHTSDKFLVAIVTNKSDVKATITVSAGDTATITVADGASSEDGYEDKSDDAAACFSIKFYQSDTKSADDATAEISGTTTATLEAKTTDTPDAIYIFAEVTWTSQDTSGNGDVLDTWIGQYAETVSWTLTYTAVQASELPTTPAP